MQRRQFVHHTSLALLGSLFWNCQPNKRIELPKNAIIGCFGDSIMASPEGYITMVQKFYRQEFPINPPDFLNWAKSSETVTGLTETEHPGPRPYLFERLDGLLESQKIDIALFCYGINDGIYGRPSPMLFERYTTGIYSFLEKIRQRKIKAVLLTPPPLALDVAPVPNTTNRTDFGYLNPYPKYNEEVLEEFRDIVLGFEHESISGTIDIHTPLYKNRRQCYDQDPIHPNSEGHRIIAERIFDNVGLS